MWLIRSLALKMPIKNLGRHSHGGQGENTMRGEQPPIKEANHPRVIFSSHPFLLILIAIS
jgi:hypothetical protein